MRSFPARRLRAAYRGGFVLAVAIALSSCGSSQSAGSRPSDTSPSPGATITVPVALEPANVAFGQNWYTVETYSGQTFRWGHDGAELTFAGSARQSAKEYLDIEPGPGIAPMPMHLTVESAAPGEKSLVSYVLARRTVIALPTSDGGVRLHVVNGGHVATADPRKLDFRIFSISSTPPALTPQAGDVTTSSDIALGAHWGVVENYAGKTFRWIDNDAKIAVPAGSDRSLIFTAEAGPGVGAKPFSLNVVGAGGKPLAIKRIGTAPTTVAVHIPDGAETVTLHVDGGGQKTPLDPRILNFRVFAIGLRQQ